MFFFIFFKYYIAFPFFPPTNLILFCRKFRFRYFPFLKIAGPLKPATGEKEGNLLPSVSTTLAFWHNRHTSVVFQAHHILQ